jgi:hypothetical protein
MRKRPFILSALVVTALLALAASAAHTNPLSAAGRRSGAIPTTLVSYAFTTFIIVAVIGFIVAAPFIPARVGGGEARPHPARAARTLVILLVTVLLIVFIARHLTPELKDLLQQGSNSGQGQGPGGKVGKPATPQPAFQWGELFVLLGLAAVLVGFLVFRLRRTDPESGSLETLTEAISQSLDDLRADPDPRRAIVAAYARMERALAASGVPRRPAEAPHEYLERALLAVDASAGAARRLTDLFVRAKFSQHEPDAGMRDEAIAALEAIRDELAALSEIAA